MAINWSWRPACWPFTIAVLRRGLHPLAEAPHAAEHRHRRPGRRHAALGRLGGGRRRHAPPNAWLLVAIIFIWTPPHFWALSLYTTGDYAKAGVPMMPVVRGARLDSPPDSGLQPGPGPARRWRPCVHRSWRSGSIWRCRSDSAAYGLVALAIRLVLATWRAGPATGSQDALRSHRKPEALRIAAGRKEGLYDVRPRPARRATCSPFPCSICSACSRHCWLSTSADDRGSEPLAALGAGR